MPKPVSDLEKYLAGEFAEDFDSFRIFESEREPIRGETSESCPLKRLLEPFTRKGS
jgi:hypothetical protein